MEKTAYKFNQRSFIFHLETLIEFSKDIFDILENKKIKKLSELNITLINKVFEFLQIKSNFILSSEFGFKEKRAVKLLEICIIFKL